APAIALDQDNIAPFTQPNKLAFAKVIKNAGSGAAIDWKIIRKKDITGAHIPKDSIYSFTASTSKRLNKWTMFLIPFLTGVTNIHINATTTRTPILIHTDLLNFLNLINQPFLNL